MNGDAGFAWAEASGGGGCRTPRPCPPLLYVYEADGGDGHGVCGVTDVFAVAERRLAVALLDMPYGAAGGVRLAVLDMNALPFPSYRYGPVVARAWRDARTGALRRTDDAMPGRG